MTHVRFGHKEINILDYTDIFLLITVMMLVDSADIKNDTPIDKRPVCLFQTILPIMNEYAEVETCVEVGIMLLLLLLHVNVV